MAAAFALAAIILRLATRATFPTEWDSAQLALGVHHFDVRIDQPHPPGYWSYVFLGRLLWWATPLSAHTCLVIVSALGSALSVVVAYAVGSRLGGRRLAIALAAVFLTNPLLWFYGSTVATYGFDAIAGGLVLLLAVDGPARRWERIGIPFAVAACGGFRPSLLVFVAPVIGVLLVVRRERWRDVVEGGLAGLVGVLVWLVPLALEQPGGLSVVRAENASFWSDAAHFTSPFFGASARLIDTNVRRTIGWTVASIAPFLLCVVGWRRPSLPRRFWLTAGAVVALQVLSALLLHFGKAGYVAGYLPAMVVMLVVPALRSRVGAVLVGVAVVVQAVTFVRADGLLPASVVGNAHEAPYRATKKLIDGVDITVARHLSLGDDFPADRTVFVFPGGPGDNLYRQLSYLEPELELHFLTDGYDWTRSRDRLQTFERDHRVEAPPGSDIVVVTSAPSAELRALERAGRAEAVELRSGAVVWVVAHGVTLHQVRLG